LQNEAKDVKVIASVGRPKVVKLSASGSPEPLVALTPLTVTDAQITLSAQFANVVHSAVVAPMQNATRRAQEMHFEYKNVTSFRGGEGASPPDQGLCPWISVIGSRSTLTIVPSESRR